MKYTVTLTIWSMIQLDMIVMQKLCVLNKYKKQLAKIAKVGMTHGQKVYKQEQLVNITLIGSVMNETNN